ncbi:MAG TPA: glutamate racemase [Steroidobacteraceae bacterium]
MNDTAAPIGVFDSGVGGLTVLAALRRRLPGEDFVYLGDTARLPYGTKSAATVVRYSLQCAQTLITRRIRCLVVACNTASASALPALRSHYPELPIIGVIEPGAEAAVRASRSRHIAVIGTEGTIKGGAYQTAIALLDGRARVEALPCSLFVAMAEEGFTEGAIAEAVARRYLDPIFGAGEAPDTLVLGCTHFPLLKSAIAAVLPQGVAIVDSALTTAEAVASSLPALAPRAPGRGGGLRILATDGAERFARVGSEFLREPLSANDVEIVDL